MRDISKRSCPWLSYIQKGVHMALPVLHVLIDSGSIKVFYVDGMEMVVAFHL